MGMKEWLSNCDKNSNGDKQGMQSDPQVTDTKKNGLRTGLIVSIAVILAVAVFSFYGKFATASSNDKSDKKDQKPPTPVSAVAAKTADVKVYLGGLGSVTPSNSVTVRSRVDGQIMDILFKEGQMVKKGDLLAQIDPRPFEVQLAQAEGQMMRDNELLGNAKTDLERYRILWKQDSVPRQQLDTQEALVRQYEAALKIDQGLVDNAKLQITYSKITSPITGRTGLRLVDSGNMVRASDSTGIVVITQLQPANVIFSLPEDSLPQVLEKINAGEKLAVEALDREQNKKLATGILLTVDNQIDPSTGTVKLKAVFQNEKNELFPNQFVNARLLVDIRHDSIVVPSSAIQRNPQGAFVYVVKDNTAVETRTVIPGVNQGNDTSVTSGLSENEVVVVDGTERLKDGSKVEIRSETKEKGSGASPRKQDK